MKTHHLFLLNLCLIVSVVDAQEKGGDALTDIEGNVYKTAIIGKYEWMADNLRVTKYNDGVSIPNIQDKNTWSSLKGGAYCWYNNSDSNAVKYGALYNWHTISTEKLCPDNWRVPSDEEWIYLEGYVDSKFKLGNSIWTETMGRGSDVGVKLKAKSGWNSEGNGTDSYGFYALPAGERISKGTFFLQGQNGFWWSRSENDAVSSWYRGLFFCGENIIRNTHPKIMGFSVRCIRDK